MSLELSPKQIAQLIAARHAALTRATEIESALNGCGVAIEDTQGGTTWKRITEETE